jgi:membrane-bound inhibitor of C-type lysozyme
MGSRIVIAMVVLSLAGCAGPGGMQRQDAGISRAASAAGGETPPSARYISADGQGLKASFDNAADAVDLVLQDGRMLRLPQGLSASGVRYTDGRETFWEHHGEGSYWQGEKLIFRGTMKEESRPR